MGNCKSQCDQMSLSSSNNVDCTRLIIIVKTWQKDVYQLFDYENAANIDEQKFAISNEGYLVGRNNLEWVETKQLVVNQLCKIKKRNENYFLIIPNLKKNYKNQAIQKYEETNTIINKTGFEKIGKRVWNVIHEGGMLLQEGDVIKLGRVKFSIRLIALEVKAQEQRCDYESSESISPDQITCRICCSSQNSSNNPLLNPCMCSGSIKYVHLECLKIWLRMKLESRQSDNCLVYLWKNLECELCKYNYPSKFKSDDTYYDLVELCKPNDYPYLMMEFKKKQLDCHKNSGVYILKFQNVSELRVGRSNDADIIINDISVSRNHAKLVIIDKKVYLFDNHSKFGTLNLIRSERMQIQRGMEVQIGRSLISFS
ncbi:unnamed protein product (macronuclear) [Paramecium tetraurelia]|uniref:FHA domain-containing protein n=1 Tax=Paramecium tetraurelia TaxID=5888 RepID=A0DTF4_PARTE|nr:uncharacterized protein GSPATT00020002001 [Paramecium tetraurelia]CAK86321.1 unnamed protein product [Paramecium tetraurelia]|eukprot:XP_001453718.1 hypothetical protein (macronuclear) [Paramecium tetraurelia strain d4-2]